MFTPAKEFRPDIQGMRAIGALLVMIFHIWIPKVSGGVDVFFVISGFLMTQVFIGMLHDKGFKPFQFWTNVIGRIAPMAYLVMAATAIASYGLMSPVDWKDTLAHFWHAALQLENWNLIGEQVGYLQRDRSLSPFQQYWALSLQVQFYIVLPFFLGGLSWLYKATGKKDSLVLTLLAFSWLVSFGFAVWLAGIDEKAAYFHSGARAWEFITGIMLAFVRSQIKVSTGVANGLAAFGIGLLLLTGIVLPADAAFPSWPALMPVIAASLVILTGSQATTIWFSWLRAPWLVSQGSYGFSIYLWHWPLLVFALNWLDKPRLSVDEGLMVIAGALVLARLSYSGLEKPLKHVFTGRVRLTWAIAMGLVFSTLSLAYGGKKALYEYINPAIPEIAMPVMSEPNPRLGPTLDLDEVSLKRVITAPFDMPRAVLNNCDPDIESDEVIPCEFGDLQSRKTVVLVGGSHASQWGPTFDVLGKTRGFKLISITKSSCTFGYNFANNPACERWNNKVLDVLHKLNPSLVVVVATRMPYRNEPWGKEYIPYGYIQKWVSLDEAGIPILGLRDNPFYELNPYTCAWINSFNLKECAKAYDELYLPYNPAKTIEEKLRHFKAADLSTLFCPDGNCYPVIDGIPLWRDNHHLTRSFMRYVAVKAGRLIDAQSPGTLPPERLTSEVLRAPVADVQPSKLEEVLDEAVLNAKEEALDSEYNSIEEAALSVEF